LSGGQCQRVAIARALALRSPIVLADEPTSGLDTRTARGVLSLFRGIAQAQETTFLIVSHDPMITEYVDTAYDLQDGGLVPRLKQPGTGQGASTNGDKHPAAHDQKDTAAVPDGARDT
jgi:ABC-type lipoprotein export system ATPase subunit